MLVVKLRSIQEKGKNGHCSLIYEVFVLRNQRKRPLRMRRRPVEGAKGRTQEGPPPIPSRSEYSWQNAARQGANLNMFAPAFADSGMVDGWRFDMVASRP